MSLKTDFCRTYNLATKGNTRATLRVAFARPQDRDKLPGLVRDALTRPYEAKLHLTRSQIDARLERDRTAMLVGIINDEPVSAIFVPKLATSGVPETEQALVGPLGNFAPTDENGKHFWCPLVVVPGQVKRAGYRTNLPGVSQPVALGPIMVYSAKQFALEAQAETLRALSRPSNLLVRMEERFGPLEVVTVNGGKNTQFKRFLQITGREIMFWLRPGWVDVRNFQTEQLMESFSLREHWYLRRPDKTWGEPAAFLHDVLGGQYVRSLSQANPNDWQAFGYRTVIAHQLTTT